MLIESGEEVKFGGCFSLLYGNSCLIRIPIEPTDRLGNACRALQSKLGFKRVPAQSGSLLQRKFNPAFEHNLNLFFGLCSLGIGICSMEKLQHIPSVVLAVIVGNAIGLVVQLGRRISLLQAHVPGTARYINRLCHLDCILPVDLKCIRMIHLMNIRIVSLYDMFSAKKGHLAKRRRNHES